MKFKKMMALVASTVLCVGMLAGCGSTSSSTGSQSTSSKSDKKVIGFAQVGAESGWRTAETDSIKSIPTLDSNFDLKFSDGQQKQENQIKAIRSFIAQKVDLIALDPVVETGWDTVLQEAKDAKIPVVIVDRNVTVSDDSLYKCFLGSDMEEEGKKAAQIVIDQFGKDAKLNIAELQGTVGSTAMVGRQKGFNETIKDCPNYKIVKSQTGDFTRAKGKEVMEAFLKSDGDNINVLWSHNDDMAVGAIQAIEEYGKQPGKDIFIVSCDGIKDMFQLMADGKSNAIVECNPLLGPQLLEVSKDILDGKDVERSIKSKESQFLQKDAATELPNRQY
ncbi:ABC transporter substrate-binding protein [Clostridium saccharobutylicum]|uniref:ABC transporter periplasmic-binding protein YtfQ n=1 Tax=Clostridium saccharobutylicum DSM 13864 TaxID=1345695 RepID=U5MQP8_CLOSA|nr:ABC transporter substrate-binding protein [Clostridium saccharobutylicum]AGX41762.1 ABC transporter periplasmic-binding protein YtfQ [Clostridium saccharobutylicum DSM 13864]AQR89041.1 ABC transporter periplasmic-binding protein YtfQ precursor [Clostridium saccharobutylicum]AQR98942.1 ABC transporter periplasmic-binding protein YtfQ precursor [Clostridium saccharobutylicum]AQS12930.1 ABC transporter periplasmic-binding protein YtfQ precursor [Clostridium saccharobutylicum]MBA2903953.1 simpl